jgi:hypothetical protein
VFPESFVALLDDLGIDPSKDAEVYHNGRVSPGRHSYGGWYHFVGELVGVANFSALDLNPEFSVWLCAASAPRLPVFDGASVVQVEFLAGAVPWLLREPEAN